MRSHNKISLETIIYDIKFMWIGILISRWFGLGHLMMNEIRALIYLYPAREDNFE